MNSIFAIKLQILFGLPEENLLKLIDKSSLIRMEEYQAKSFANLKPIA